MNQYIRNIGIALIIYILAVMYIVQGEVLGKEDRILIVVFGILVCFLTAICPLNEYEK
jgi:hypothetical protein